MESEKISLQKKREELKKELSHLDDQQKVASASAKNLFGTHIKNNNERISRLERAVQDMHNEFDSVKPSIKRLMELEGEIQTLINELQQLNQNDNHVAVAAAPVQVHPNTTTPAPTYTPAKKSNYQGKSAPAMTNGRASVYNVRIGEHPGKTRIVLDTNGKTPFNVDIDNGENIAIIDLSQAGWSASKSKSLSRSKLITSYNVESSGNGHLLILQLKRNAKVTYKADLKGTSGNSRRLVIDLQ